MLKEDLITIRKDIGLTQVRMAELLRCATVGYHRYEAGTRAIPAYIALSAKAVQFLYKHDLLKKFEKFCGKEIQKKDNKNTGE
jgi:transcriptional regulator with XRE-family HTH domain